MKRVQSSEIEAAMALIAPDSDTASPEYQPRVAITATLFCAYDVDDEGRVDQYIDALWTEVPLWWLALAVRRLIAERVYPSLPTPGDVRRVARELAGMDRPVYLGAAGYSDAPRRRWPPVGKRHGVEPGALEPLQVGPLRIEAGSHPELSEGGKQTHRRGRDDRIFKPS